jgi:AraC family transcriptional regulator, transcriptional activator FtrA
MPEANGHTVATVAYDQLCTFEFGVAVEVFGLPRPEFDVDWYRFQVWTADPGPLKAAGGISFTTDTDVTGLTEADTVVIPGWRDPDEVPPEPLLDAVSAAAERGARLVSICSGVFVLAAAGLLDGRRATTHWRYLDLLSSRFPAIDVQPNVLYIGEDNIFTSAGSSAGIDLCIHIVRLDYGADVAAQVARRLIVPPHREGDQAQYAPRPLQPSHAGPSLAQVMEWAVARLDEEIQVADMANVALMAPRTFARRFREETGTTPHRWLTLQRLHRSQELLETTSESVEWIARTAGFRTAETLRHHFRQQYRTTPSRYRQRFVLEG